jgi:hypothetical protein
MGSPVEQAGHEGGGAAAAFLALMAALARNPIRGAPAAVPMITKGRLETVTQHLAMEYA